MQMWFFFCFIELLLFYVFFYNDSAIENSRTTNYVTEF